MTKLDKIKNRLVNMGLPGEIIGIFVWCQGEHENFKEDLINLGFRYSKRRNAWYYREKTTPANQGDPLQPLRNKFNTKQVGK